MQNLYTSGLSARAFALDRALQKTLFAATSGVNDVQLNADHELRLLAHASEAPAFNTAAMVRLSGVPAPTLRAWESRYGFPEPKRGPGGQRLYSERDVKAVHWLRARMQEGLSISAAVALLRSGPRQRMADAPAVLSASWPDRSPGTCAGELERALLAFDAARAGRVLGEAFGLHAVEQVCLEVIQPTLRAIGQGWHEGSVDVAQEHFASNYLRQRLAALLDLCNVGDRGRTAVAACPPDEWHEIGLLMVSLFLARRGWRVVYLGSNLPPDGLEDLLARLRPAAVVFSASTDQSATAVATVVGRLKQRPGPGPLVGYGGRAFEQEPSLRDMVPGLYLGPDAATAALRLDRALPTDSTRASMDEP
jgi:DNA-binding transcriptional MerR regulator/methylmalonyl-CoA mutase cobalamin-binding subunit